METKIHTFDHPADTVDDVSWSPDDRWVAASGRHGIHLYDIKNGRQLLHLHVGRIHWKSLCWGDRLFTADVNGFVKMWNVDGLLEMAAAKTAQPTRLIAMDETAQYVVTPGGGRSLQVWDVQQRRPISNVPLSTRQKALAVSRGGTQMTAITSMGQVQQIDLPPQAERKWSKLATDAKGRATCIQYDTSGTQLAVGDASGRISIFDTETRKLRQRLQVSGSAVRNLDWSEKGDRIAVALRGKIVVWDVGSQNKVAECPVLTNDLECLAWSHNDKQIAFGTGTAMVGIQRF